ncbi:TonB-dependent receptor [Phenylobacterium sp.]|uniref:TonB-dependent receptor n=1 Tax=Phenylobacterium sp. TaxID=1871053 RepID=UPI002DF4A15C|nr:TonB-dependent receptor [Phenylobacterium sp.]
MNRFSRALCATTALATGLLLAGSAFAQSTATQVQELIITGNRQAPSTAGLATQVNEAKDVSIVGKAFIETQMPSANIAQLINVLPGVSYSTEDPGGFNSGDLRIHGFDGNHVAVILDGAPLNDTGNYAVFPGEYMIGELIDHITVNVGSADVDSPSASALGATINAVSKLPKETPGGMLRASAGSYKYLRGFGEYDTGAIGPWGTRAFVAGEYGTEHNFKGRPGTSKRWDVSGRIYQPLSGNDFLSLAGIYVQERQYPAFRLTRAQISSLGFWYFGDNPSFTPETVTPGRADLIPANAGPSGADNNFYALFPNPVNFGSLRGQSHFTLAKNLVLTVDPSLFYTLANGGGGTTLKENDPRLIGNSTASGVDLNGDGDTLDTLVAYGPSNTRTHRVGLTTSLLYDLNESNHFQLAYTLDYGRHRQTGEFTPVDLNTGLPQDVFGGSPAGGGADIKTADGAILRGRDRFSIAILNQVSANYIGKFIDDRLHINLGVRMPDFERKLNQFCYTFNGTSAYCDTIDPAAVQTAFNADVAAVNAAVAAGRAPPTTATNLAAVFRGGITPTIGPNGLPNFRFPFKADLKYRKTLPNAGISFRLAEDHLIYASYAKGLAAPKTDNLYTSSPNLVQPETSNNYAAGYRYQTNALNVSANLYRTDYKNRIVSSPDPLDPTLSIDRNVGDVRIQGVDLELGYTPIDHLHLYASANLNKSKVLKSYTLSTSGISFQLPVAGKELVLTPDRIFNGRISYDAGPVTLGLQAKYMSSRWLDDLNTDRIPGYAVFGADARWNLPWYDGAYLQFNVQNLFDRRYISRATTNATNVAFPIPNTTPPRTFFASTSSLQVGAPRTAVLTLGVNF